MSYLKEFKEFAVKGNVIDMAVGVIIGTAFGNIVKSLVDDVIMPPLGLLVGNMDFSNLFVVLKSGPKSPAPYHSLVEAVQSGATLLKYGVFINTIVNFTIVAFAIFIAIKQINRFKHDESTTATPDTPPLPSEEIIVLREIRDALQHKSVSGS